MNKAREFDQSVLSELKALLGERVSTSSAVREHHGKDESYFPYALPDAVVFPHSTEEVRDVVNICRRHRVPMIPFGVSSKCERIRSTSFASGTFAVPLVFTQMFSGSGWPIA